MAEGWCRGPFLSFVAALTDLNGSIVKCSGYLGHKVGCSPSYFALVPILVSFTLCLGFRDLRYATDLEDLFVPKGSAGFDERREVERHFATNYQRYSPGRETRLTPRVDVILTPESGSSALTRGFWTKAKAVDTVLKNLTVSVPCNPLQSETKSKALNLTFNDVCASKADGCYTNSFLDLSSHVDDFKTGTYQLVYPTTANPITGEIYLFPTTLGGVELKGSVIKDVGALRLSYVLDPDVYGASIWEEEVLRVSLKLNISGFRISSISSQSIPRELVSNIHHGMNYVEHTVVLLVTFSFLCTSFASEGATGKGYVACVGIFNAILAIGAAWGLLAFLGVRWQSINLAGLFLLMGIGMDDAFIMLAAWKRSSRCLDVPERLKYCYREGMPSITVSSTTNFVGLAVAALSPEFESVRIFCTFAAVGILFIYVWTLTFFGACLAVSGRLEEQERHHLFFLKDLQISREKIAFSFGSSLAGLLSKKQIRVFLGVLCAGYWAFSVYGILGINEGLQKRNLALSTSYCSSFYSDEDRFFRLNPYRFHVVIGHRLDYSDPKVGKNVSAMLQSFTNSGFIESSENFTENWLDMFDKFVAAKSRFEGPVRVNTEETFTREVLKVMEFQKEAFPMQDYVRLNEAGTQILASRFFMQSSAIADTYGEMTMINELRDIARRHNVTVFHPLNPYWDQFLRIRSATVEIVGFSCAAVFCVTLALLPKKQRIKTSIWIALVVLSIELGVCGSMHYLDINLDVISMICLTICVGFSVDFSAHVAYHYLASDDVDPLRSCLEAVGVPVIQAGLSTTLGVSLILLPPSYILSSFATMVCLVMLFGMVHGLVLLPVLLDTFSSPNGFIQRGGCCFGRTAFYRRDEDAFVATRGTFRTVEEDGREATVRSDEFVTTADMQCKLTPAAAAAAAGLPRDYTRTNFAFSFSSDDDDDDLTHTAG